MSVGDLAADIEAALAAIEHRQGGDERGAGYAELAAALDRLVDEDVPALVAAVREVLRATPAPALEGDHAEAWNRGYAAALADVRAAIARCLCEAQTAG